jgi:hypothetical protein
VCSWIVAVDVLAADALAADALAADALADALAVALAVAEAVDWEVVVACGSVVVCGVVACGDVVSPVVVVVVPVCAPVVPVVAVVVPVVGIVVPVVVPVVPVVVPVVPVVAVIVPVVGVVVPVVVVVVGVVDSGRGVVAARSSRFATVGPTSPLIPRWMVAFEEELSVPSVSTLAHSFSLNTLTTARPRPLGSPPPCTSSCPPQDEPRGWCVGDPSPPSRGRPQWLPLSLNQR